MNFENYHIAQATENRLNVAPFRTDPCFGKNSITEELRISRKKEQGIAPLLSLKSKKGSPLEVEAQSDLDVGEAVTNIVSDTEDVVRRPVVGH